MIKIYNILSRYSFTNYSKIFNKIDTIIKKLINIKIQLNINISSLKLVTLIYFMLIFFLNLKVFAFTQITNTDPYQRDHLSLNSQKIWLADNITNLKSYENSLVKQISLRPYYDLSYYHLGLYYIKLAILSDDESVKNHLLHKASLMARQIMNLHPQNYLGFLVYAYIGIAINEYHESQMIFDYIEAVNSKTPLESYPLKSLLISSGKIKDSNEIYNFIKSVQSSAFLKKNLQINLVLPAIKKLNILDLKKLENSFSSKIPNHWHYILAHAYDNFKDHATAKIHYKKAIKSDFNHLWLYYDYANLMVSYNPALTLKLTEKCLTSFKQINKVKSSLLGKNDNEHINIYWLRGMSYLLLKNPKLAVKNHLLAFEQSLYLDKNYFIKMLNSLKIIYQHHNFDNHWLDFLKKLNIMAPGYHEIHNLIAQHYLKTHKIKLAQASFIHASLLKNFQLRSSSN